MYTISNEAKTALNKSFRDESHVRITYGLVDPDAPSLSTLVDNGHLGFSDVTEIDNIGFTVEKTYETLEPNRFILNDLGIVKAIDDTFPQGYVSSEMSKIDRTFNTNPTITITFSEVTSLAGLTIDFDTIKNSYPSLFNIKAYNGVSLSYNNDYTPNTSSAYVVPTQMDDIDKIVFEFKETAIPYRRIRLNKLIYGILINLATEDITKCELKQSIELNSFELPLNEFNFEILDIDRNYDPENPSNYLDYLEAGQEVAFFIGQTLDDNSIEWIPMCLDLTTGEAQVTDGGVAKLINFKTQSLLVGLNTIYDEGIYYVGGHSLADLITDVITFAGVQDKFIIDSSLNSITTKVMLYNMSCKECLQLLVNAGNCNFNIQRDGKIKIEPVTFGTTEFDFTLSNSITDPTFKSIPRIKNFYSKYYDVSLEADSEIASVDISGATNLDVIVNYEPASSISYTNVGLTVNGSPTIFGSKMLINVTGSGTIKVRGSLLKYTEVAYNVNVNPQGSDISVSNTLISDLTTCANWVTFQSDLFAHQHSYSFDQRGFPQLDVQDDVTFQNIDEDTITGKIIENTISFDGTLKGKTKVVAI